jgi:hypothetical protein
LNEKSFEWLSISAVVVRRADKNREKPTIRRDDMRFIITTHPKENGTAHDGAATPSNELLTKYMQYNEELHKAGVLVAAEGLNPGAKGARIEVNKGKRTLVDGPYAESKELVGGFYILEVKSREEAIAWALRCPSGLGFDDVMEIRPLTGAGDLPPSMIELIHAAAPTWSETFKTR